MTMSPKYAGAFHKADADGFKALVAGLNKADQLGYAPVHFCTTADGMFAVLLAQPSIQTERAAQEAEGMPSENAKRVYPRFFSDEGE